MPFYENIKDNLLKGKLVLNSFIKTLQYIYISGETGLRTSDFGLIHLVFGLGLIPV